MTTEIFHGEDAALYAQYQLFLSQHIIFLMFAGLYRDSSREKYESDVTDMLKGWEANMRHVTNLEANRRKFDKNFDARRYRLAREEAITLVAAQARQHLLLYNKPPEQATQEAEATKYD